MPVTAPSLKETYELLDKALLDIGSKKKVLDGCQKEVEALTEKLRLASEDYENSIQYARDLKAQLANIVDNVLPVASQKVR